MIQSIRRSLGARILLLAALNLAVLIAIGLAASGVRVPRNLPQMMIQVAEPRLQDVARRIALDLERTQPAEADALLDRYATEYRTRFVLVRNDGTRIAGADLPIPDEVRRALAGPPPPGGSGLRLEFRPMPPPFPPPDRPGPHNAPPGPRMPQTPAHLVRGGAGTWIVLRTPIRFAGAAEIVAGSLLLVPYRFLGDPLLFPLSGLWWVMLGLAVTVACWWPLLRGLTKSLGRMEHATSEIAQGRFATKIDVSRADEVGRLSSSIEQMSGRLGALVSGQKRFLGDTAHELRSPLGRMQIALEILDARVQDTERAYVADLKEDVEALSALTDELLQYARAELSDRSRTLDVILLTPLVERIVARERQDATFEVALDPGQTVIADPALLERALANVIRNAVKYAGASGPIAVTSTVENDRLVVSIADQGPGVSPDSVERIFDPFYREDAARNRKTGGVGLGLAIVRSAMEACGGSAQCRNRQPHGLDVRLALPVVTVARSS